MISLSFRRFFAKLEAPNDRGRYLQELLNSFAVRFCQCNPHLGYSVGKNNYIFCTVNYVRWYSRLYCCTIKYLHIQCKFQNQFVFSVESRQVLSAILSQPFKKIIELKIQLNLLRLRTMLFLPISLLISDSIYVLCFSLILLSVDLGSPHVKNKMSKREFIRNTRSVIKH